MKSSLPTGEMRSVRPAPSQRDGVDRLNSVREHLNILYSVATRVLGDRDEAEDAVQEALLTFWNLDGTPPNLRAWLVRTVLHRSLHARRTVLRRRKWEARAGEDLACRSLGVPTLPEPFAGAPCELCAPGDELERRQLREALEASLAGLSEEHRLVLSLREIQNLDYEAIAQTLSVPVGTVRSRLNRARAALRIEFASVAPEMHGDFR